MGRAEGKSSAGAIAVVVIAGVLVLALLGCGGLAAMSWLFVARSAKMPTVSAPPPTSVVAEPIPSDAITVTNNAEGLGVIDGTTYTDDELREKLPGLMTANERYVILLDLSPDISNERREALENIIAEASP
jgi:hypothetical protein